MSIQPPIREGLQDMDWTYSLALSICFGWVIANHSRDDDRCFSWCEHVPRSAKDLLWLRSIVRKIKVCDETKKRCQSALCECVSIIFDDVSLTYRSRKATATHAVHSGLSMTAVQSRGDLQVRQQHCSMPKISRTGEQALDWCNTWIYTAPYLEYNHLRGHRQRTEWRTIPKHSSRIFATKSLFPTVPL